MVLRENTIALLFPRRPGIDHTPITLTAAIKIDTRSTAQHLIDTLPPDLRTEDMKTADKDLLLNITKHLKVN